MRFVGASPDDSGRESPSRGHSSRALLVDDPRFDAHRPSGHHPERPERLAAARAAVASVPIAWERVPCGEATLEQLVRVHDERFVEALSAERGGRGFLDADTYVSEGSVDAAFRAAGGAVALVDALVDGPIHQGVALLRPPGHHARPARAMGFCLLNNVAVAAAHARARGVGRVAIVDFDVHHGNGTQEMFWSDPSVLYVSTHQFPFYPGTGAADEVGEGDGTGYTVNVPLRAGGGDAEYRAAFERIVEPVLAEFAPELVLVSAGFDAAARDPLAEMRVSADAFAYMGSALARQAAASAGGRIALVLEGGYDLPSLEQGLVRAMEGAFLGAGGSLAAASDTDDVRVALGAAKRAWHLG
jgi:acetoin utilization deacetylase AcuC-like enzyme